MATFTGTAGFDSADAVAGTLVGFTGGTIAELQDATGDVFIGGFNVDTVVAGGGDDFLQVNEGEFADDYNGGAGTDVLDLSGLTADTATVDLSAGTYTTSIGGGTRSISSVEQVWGGGAGDAIRGRSSGSDTLKGTGGADLLDVELTGDSLDGGAGDDTIYAMTAADPTGSG
ncbi:MAG: hypothetical protein HXY21_01565, partial [Parvularculaceae bacterium]|nr:hypothetical protein [Parvularculaceae bacterium]